MFMVRELYLPVVGYLGLLGLDVEGGITLVECKLKASPEIRRWLVGQVLAYAAGLWGLSYEELDAAFSARCGVSLVEQMAQLGDGKWDEQIFRSNLTSNLAAGRFRLVIAVDEISDELKQTVLFLNEHTQPELRLSALELGYIADDDVEILIPVVSGRESADRKVPRDWDEPKFLSALVQQSHPEGARAIRRLYDFSLKRGAKRIWARGEMPGLTLHIGSREHAVSWSCYIYPNSGAFLHINFGHLVGDVPQDQLSRLAGRLREIPGVHNRLKGLEEAEFNRFPGVPVATVLTQPGAVEAIQRAFEEILGPETSSPLSALRSL